METWECRQNVVKESPSLTRPNPLGMGLQPNCGLIILCVNCIIQNLNELFHYTGLLSKVNVTYMKCLRNYKSTL